MKTNNVERDALIAYLCVLSVFATAEGSLKQYGSVSLSPVISTPSSTTLTNGSRAGLREAPVRQMSETAQTSAALGTPVKSNSANPFATPHFERMGTPAGTAAEAVNEPKTPTRNFTERVVHDPTTPVANRRAQFKHAPEKIERIEPTAALGTPVKSNSANPFATPHFERMGTPAGTAAEAVNEPKTPTRNFTERVAHDPTTPVANRRAQFKYAPEKIENVFKKREKTTAKKKKKKGSRFSSSRDSAAYDLDEMLKICPKKESFKEGASQTTRNTAINQTTRRGTLNQNSSNAEPLDGADDFLCNGENKSREREKQYSTWPFDIPRPEAKPLDLTLLQQHSAPSRTENEEEPEMPRELLGCFAASAFDGMLNIRDLKNAQQMKLRKNFDTRVDTLIKFKEYAYKLIASNLAIKLMYWNIAPIFLELSWEIVRQAELEGNAIMGRALVKTRYFKDNEVLPLLWCEPLLSYLSGETDLNELLECYREEQADKMESERLKEEQRLREEAKRHAAAAAAQIKKECDDKLRVVAERRAVRAAEKQKANQGEMKQEVQKPQNNDKKAISPKNDDKKNTTTEG